MSTQPPAFSPMNLQPADERLTAYALGELPEAEMAEMEALLAASPDARKEVDEIRQFASQLKEAFAAESANAPKPELDALLAASPLAQEPTAPVEVGSSSSTEPLEPELVHLPPAPVWWRRGWILTAAAAVVVLASSVFLPPLGRLKLAQQTSESTPPTSLGGTEAIAPAPAGSVLAPAPANNGRQVSTSPRGDRAVVAQKPAPPASVQSPVPSSAPTAPTAPTMEPSLMRRYGLAPSPGNAGVSPTPGGEPGRANVGGMSPELRTRYGLGPSTGTDLGPAPEQERRLVRPGQDRGAESNVRLLVKSDAGARGLTDQYGDRDALRRGERVQPQANPGYVDVGMNGFLSPLNQPLSTFGLDVDTGSYANVRRFLNAGAFPPAAAVRVEEMINYFPYAYPSPRGDDVFGVQADVAVCPWEPRHRLVRLALKATAVQGDRSAANLVFLVDVSGSMQPGDRLPLLKQALRALTKRLSPADRVAIVTYASQAGVRLPSTSAEAKDRILEAIDSLEAGGSTNGEGGIRQAYEVARRHFIPGGVNRVFLCTDGDFNVGISDQDELVRLIESEAQSGVFLTALGVGTDNFKDALMRRLADRGNGSYHFLDSFEEAQRVLLEQKDATFVVVARDAKAQVEFNPGTVAAWRLIGYEKRLLAAEDFNDDTKDAGEVGAGQTVTVLYEVVPAGEPVPGAVDPLKYQPVVREAPSTRGAVGDPELLTLKLRYQRPEGSRSTLKEVPVLGRTKDMEGDFRFAAAVAAFGMALRDPSWHGGRGFDLALSLAQQSLGEDPGGWRAEFLTLVRKARGMRRAPETRWIH